MVMLSLSRWGLLLMLCGLCFGIYREQAGEYDRISRQIGIIRLSLFDNHSNYVATEAGVIAALKVADGAIAWRQILANEAVLDLISGMDCLLSLSTAKRPLSSSTRLLSVRAWNLLTGDLLWERTITGPFLSTEWPLDIHPRPRMVFSAAQHRISVLTARSLHLFNTKTGRAAEWHAPTVADSAGNTVVLFGLIPLTSDDSPTSDRAAAVPERVACGCMVAGSTDMKCKSIVVIQFSGDSESDVPKELFQIDVLELNSSLLSPASAHVVVSSNAAIPYRVDDVVFGYADGSMHIVSLDTMQEASLSLPAEDESEVSSASLHVLTDSDGELTPGASICYRGSPLPIATALVAEHCKNFALFLSPATQQGEDSSWVLYVSPVERSVDLRTHSAATAVAELSRASAVVAARLFAVELIGSAAPADVNRDGMVVFNRMQIEVLTKAPGGKAPATPGGGRDRDTMFDTHHISVDIDLSVPRSVADSRWVGHGIGSGGSGSLLSHVQVMQQQHQRGAVGAKGESSGAYAYRALLSFKMGLVMMVEIGMGAGAAESKLLWYRDTSLSYVRAVQLLAPASAIPALPSSMPVEGEAASAFSDPAAAIPLELLSFRTRLRTQLHDVAAMAARFPQQISKLQDSVKNTLGTLYPHRVGTAAAAKTARRSQSASKAEKSDLFGFNKIVVTLVYNDALARSLRSGSRASVSLLQGGVQVSALDLSRGSMWELPMWTFYPSCDLPGPDDSLLDSPVTQLLLLPHATAATHTSDLQANTSSSVGGDTSIANAQQAVSLVAILASGHTVVWNIFTATGASAAGRRETRTGIAPPAVGGALLDQHSTFPLKYATRRMAPSASGRCDFVVGSHTYDTAASHATGFDYTRHNNQHSIIRWSGDAQAVVTEGSAAADEVRLTPLGGSSLTETAVKRQPDRYFHLIDRAQGLLRIFKVNPVAACVGINSTFHTLSGESESPVHRDLPCHTARVVSSVLFPPDEERIVDVTYPSPHDVVHSRFSILGDDSVLVKYLNRNIAVVTTATVTSTAYTVGGPGAAPISSAKEDEPSVLTVSVVDVVSGKIIRRFVHEAATAPVHVLVVENMLFVSYWNTLAKRCELSSTAFYEGAIDRLELSPLPASGGASPNKASSSRRAMFSGDVQHISAYSSVPPMAMQKTYVMPRTVTALAHTVTTAGITHKSVLVGLNNGQVFSVDVRQIHPRRPYSDPTPAEKQEGLQRYNPYIFLNPLAAVTLDYSLPSGGATKIISVASALESSSLVFSFGRATASAGTGAVDSSMDIEKINTQTVLDFHLNRVMPSQGFDTLSSEFNHGLLIAILTSLLGAVLFLRRARQQKNLRSAWA